MWTLGNCALAGHWINKTDVSEPPVLLLYSSVDEHEKALGLRGAQTEIECIWAYTLASHRRYLLYVFDIRVRSGSLNDRRISLSAFPRHYYADASGPAAFASAQREAELSGFLELFVYYCWRSDSRFIGNPYRRKPKFWHRHGNTCR